MAEGRRTELQQRLAAKDRERTEAELWSLRRARALDDLGQEGDRLEQRWVHDFLRTREELGAQRIAGQATNPHFGDQARADREERRLDAELGERLGIGPPPPSWFEPS
jgi:hypothetical protein